MSPKNGTFLHKMYSNEVKHRAVIHYKFFLKSIKKVANIYSIGKSTLARWIHQDLSRKEHAKRRRKSVHSEISPSISDALMDSPYQTVSALVNVVNDASGRTVSRSTVYRSLKKLGHTFKKTQHCRDRDKLDSSHPFMMSQDSYGGDAISLDESSFYWNDIPSRAWGLRGSRVPRGRPGKRTRLNLILAIGREGIVQYSLFQGKNNSAKFAGFLKTLPKGRPVILDNSSVHASKFIKGVAAQNLIDLRFTPPYCPWYNPVEFCFSEIKSKYRPLRLARHENLEEDVTTCVLAAKHFGRYFEHAKTEWLKDRVACGLA